MRILVVSDQWFPDFAGGSARVATEIARRLARRGHELDVIVPRGHEGQPSEETAPGLRIIRALPRGRLPQTIADTVYSYVSTRRLGARYDVLLAHQATTAVGAARALPGVPLALVFHASASRESQFTRTRLRSGTRRLAALALEPLLRDLERAALSRAAAVLSLSDFSSSLILEDAPGCRGRIVRVSGGVDVSSFTPDYENARTRRGVAAGVTQLLTVRRLEPRMGLEALLQAFAAIRTPQLRLAIAGAGPLAAELRELIDTLRLDGSAMLLGRVSEEELRDWYRAADLFVLPTAAYEGFGLATVEALASGTPVVGTPVGATPEILGPLSPDLVAAGTDPDALAAAIGRGLQAIGPEFRARCRSYACRHFDWEHVTDDWEAALHAVRPVSTSGTRAHAFPPALR